MTLCDVICLYAKMNRNFKGGLDNVVIAYTDRVDNPGLQWCADGRRSSLVCYSARDKPIRVTGRFGSVRVSVGTSDLPNECAVRWYPGWGCQDRLYKGCRWQGTVN